MKEEFDFGFTTMSEDELKQYEKELEQKIVDTEKTAREKLTGLAELYKPLISNLKRDPDKHYIYWPNRISKIESFEKVVNKYIDDNG